MICWWSPWFLKITFQCCVISLVLTFCISQHCISPKFVVKRGWRLKRPLPCLLAYDRTWWGKQKKSNFLLWLGVLKLLGMTTLHTKSIHQDFSFSLLGITTLHTKSIHQEISSILLGVTTLHTKSIHQDMSYILFISLGKPKKLNLIHHFIQ